MYHNYQTFLSKYAGSIDDIQLFTHVLVYCKGATKKYSLEEQLQRFNSNSGSGDFTVIYLECKTVIHLECAIKPL